ncbi:gluconokinase [Lapidilactobacillus mulanensis]|uniref:Gluconokinase n=1 Tax=Lapidilactobacillus mulanensis TaxID=2485999 RepID=A0ABW4DMP0_9LACO|nr:FGGY family carbohydrate kinase [Lapidilactobacillus mulanensis]
MQDAFLGIDIGTTAIKFGVMSADKLAYQQSRDIRTYTGENGAEYQSAQEIITTTVRGIQAIPATIRQQISQLSFSAPMHSCWPIAPDTTENDQIFIWSDDQAQDLISQFKNTPSAREFYLKTGTPIHPMSPFAKIKYSQSISKYPAQTKWWGIKELVLQYFTGQARIDYATASATGLLNLRQLDWDAEILADLKIQLEDLAELVDCTDDFKLLEKVATELGLSDQVRVYAGASDGCLAAYAGYVATGIPNSLSIGTSAAARQVSETIRLDPDRQNFCYYLQPGQYIVGAPSNNGGNVLAWASNQLAANKTAFFDELPELLAQSPVGANGVCFMPFLNGERAPYWDATKKAAFKELTAATTRADLVRAIVEGTLLNIRALAEMVGVKTQLTLSGGFFKTPELQQLTADILGIDCCLSAANEPIAGLYALIRQSAPHNEATMAKICYDESSHQQYDQIYQGYFD